MRHPLKCCRRSLARMVHSIFLLQYVVLNISLVYPWQNACEFVFKCVMDNNESKQWVIQKSVDILKGWEIARKPFSSVKEMAAMIQKSGNKQYQNAVWTFLDCFTDCELIMRHILNVLTEPRTCRSALAVKRTHRHRLFRGILTQWEKDSFWFSGQHTQALGRSHRGTNRTSFGWTYLLGHLCCILTRQ